MKKQTAQQAFNQNLDQLMADMKRIQETLAAQNNNNVDWGDAGSMEYYAEAIRELSDKIHHEGEYA